MLTLGRDTSIPEDQKPKMLQKMREGTKHIEDDLKREAEEKKKASALDSSSRTHAVVAEAAHQDFRRRRGLRCRALDRRLRIVASAPAPATASPATLGSIVDTYA
jgi:hypothetical protein